MSVEKVSIYVPSTSNVDEEILPSEFSQRVNLVGLLLSSVFGGATAVPGNGFWLSPGGQLVGEKVEIVTSLVLDRNALTNNYERIVTNARQWAKEWGQEALLVEYGGDALFIEP